MTLSLLAVPLDPDREEARELLRRELAGKVYADERPGVLEQVIQWIWDRLDGLQLTGAGGLRPAAIVIALTLLALVVGFALYRSGGFRRSARVTGPAVLDAVGTTAAQHRAEAERAAAAGDWDGAAVARFRAVARSLEERTVLLEQPGRTAREVARDAGRVLPDLAGRLEQGADVFDRVSYGHRPAGEAGYRQVAELDDAVSGQAAPR